MHGGFVIVWHSSLSDNFTNCKRKQKIVFDVLQGEFKPISFTRCKKY